MKRFLLFSVLVIAGMALTTSCKTASQQMQILKPATITMPSSVKQLGIINRSLPAEGQGLKNFLEGFVTGESIGADREGSMQCVRGLASGLNNGPRFTAVVIEGVDYRGTGTAQWPEFLDWNNVDELCNRFRVDAIIALETFDSDISLDKRSADVERVIDKQKVVVKEYYADLRMRVRSGWTVYSPGDRQIVDRNGFSDEMRWNGSGDSPQQALNKLPAKRKAINESGFYSGNQYAYRISPSWFTENRVYFKSGNDDFKAAHKLVKKGRWQEAVPIWNKLSASRDTETAGRGCYNMALASEMEGKLDLAYEWASRAWQQHHLKKSRYYINILSNRINQQKQLDLQMQ